MPPSIAAQRLLAILEADGRGQGNALPGSVLASRMGLNPRDIGELVSELITSGCLIGSSCTAGRSGYFTIETESDLEVGTRHIVSRAVACLQRVRRLRKAAAQHFSEAQVQRLFDIDQEAS